MASLCEKIGEKEYGLTLPEFLNGTFCKMFERGLSVVSLCNDGTGRSYTIASTLCAQDIPTISLKGGLKQFIENDEANKQITCLSAVISNVPYVVVALTGKEMAHYHSVLSRLAPQAYRYTSSQSAIASLQRLISS